MNSMKRMLKKLICIVLAVTVAVVPAVYSSAQNADKTGMLLDSYTPDTESSFTLTKNSRLFILSETLPDESVTEAASLIARQLGTLDVFENTAPEIVYGTVDCARKGDIIIAIDSEADIGTEGYMLNVSDKAVITAKDTRGLIYGTGILMKILRNSTTVVGFSAKDTPDTKQRVVMLDTGRKYFTAEWIKNFIRQMSWMGYNALELHFSEDGGFRADFWDKNCYGDANNDGTPYSPVNDFSWICGSHVQSWVKDPYRKDPDKDKYLTTQELIDICNVAKEYSIDIIPSFDSPAHMDYLTWKFEKHYKESPRYGFIYNEKKYTAASVNGCINYTGTTGASSPTYPYYTTIDITDGSVAKAFVFAIYEDIADFFKEFAGSTDFSIGADEVNLSKSNVKWKYSQFPDYVNNLNRLLNSKGYTCRIFNDFIGSATNNKNSQGKARYDFDDNIEIMYWTSNFNPTTGKYNSSIWPAKFFWETETGTASDYGDGGRTIYNCIGTNCYYVLRVAASTTKFPNMDARNPENRNWSFYSSTEEIIYNKWYPADVSAKGVYSDTAEEVPEESLGGGYFLIWNDYAALNTQAEIWNGVKDNTGTSNYFYSLFDRMWSNSIKMWNQDINETVSYSDFAQIRDTFGYFPGFTNCDKQASLPQAGEISRAYLADHSELENLLTEKISNENGIYTLQSYEIYKNAYNSAVLVNENYAATEEQVKTAVADLVFAKESLIIQAQVDSEIFSLSLISRVTPYGKKAGIVMTTSTGAKTIDISKNGETVSPDEIKSDIQTRDGKEVKVWYLNFTPTEFGTQEYTVTVNGYNSKTVEIKVK